MWDYCVETDYANNSQADFSCDFNRGDSVNSLFILNHFITNPLTGTGELDSSIVANSNPYFITRANQCMTEKGKLPNFLTVDFYDVGDVFSTKDQLNANFVLVPEHVIGGEIDYECLNPAIGTRLFTVKLYRDCYGGVPTFVDTLYVSIYSKDSLGNAILFIQMDMLLLSLDTLVNNTYNFCLFAPSDICVEEAVYQQLYVLPPGTYYLTYQRCCRNQDILNIPNPESVGYGFDIVVPDTDLAVCNSSPYYNNYPPTIICLDAPFEYDHSATDPDGDSLVYYLCAPKEYNTTTWGTIPNPSGPPSTNYAVNYEVPYDPSYPIMAPIDSFRIDPVTGLLTGTPTQTGRYIVGVCCSEYRNGVLLSTNNRDFQFNIAACLEDTLSLQYTWAPDSSDPCMINFTYQGSTVVSFDWNFGVDSITADTSDLENPSYTFPGLGTYTVSLVVNEAYSCADTLDIDVTVSNCPFVSVESVGKETLQMSVFPNPSTHSFKVTLTGKNSRDWRIDVRDLSGRLKASYTEHEVVNKSLEISGNEIGKGMFFIELWQHQELLAVEKVVLLK
jgi:PKD repeat protein